MNEPSKPLHHSTGGCAPLLNHRGRDAAWPCIVCIYKIKNVFQNDCVIHRTAFEVAAISKNLFRNFARQDFQTLLNPSLRFRPFKKQSRNCECLPIHKEMICQQMMLDSFRKPSNLNRKTLSCNFWQRISSLRPLDPIHDSK